MMMMIMRARGRVRQIADGDDDASDDGQRCWRRVRDPGDGDAGDDPISSTHQSVRVLC